MTSIDVINVDIDLAGATHLVGRLRRHSGRRGEIATFEYTDEWLGSSARFAIDPALPLGRGTFAPTRDRAVAAAIGDTAPDSWGRRLMQRAERLAASEEGRRVRSLGMVDFLLGVSDESRLGALRFRLPESAAYQASRDIGVPPLVELGQLLDSTQRILRDDATAADLSLMLAPGSSLGGARPKASVRDLQGRLAIAKFPKDDDEYSLETWEAIAIALASEAGIATPETSLLRVDGRAVLLSRRFDRVGEHRLPFVSAMTMTDSVDGETGSYPDIVDALAVHGERTGHDAQALFRRIAFNILISNLDDHLRNHGALHIAGYGWRLAPAYDLNPVPRDLKTPILSTTIDGDDATCSVALLRDSATFYGLSDTEARRIIADVAHVTQGWRACAKRFGQPAAAIDRMSSAFEHEVLDDALAMEG
jgi:serine/threonine-protein kinase HipA